VGRLAAGLEAPVAADLADTAIQERDSVPVPIPIQVIPVPPVKLVGLPAVADTPPTQRRTRRSQRGRVSAYLPTVALAAVIGAGLGSLFMALAPLLQH
jgi:hypothetical protein